MCRLYITLIVLLSLTLLYGEVAVARVGAGGPV